MSHDEWVAISTHSWEVSSEQQTQVERDTRREPSQKKNWKLIRPNKAWYEKNIFSHITGNSSEQKNTLSLTSHRGYEALPSIQLVWQTIQSPLDQC